MQPIDVITIDIGYKHLVICETRGMADGKVGEFTHMQFWCLSVQMGDMVDACASLYDQLSTVECLNNGRPLNHSTKVIVERQIPTATNNIILQSWLIGWLIQNSFKTELQDARLKYKHIIGATANHKILGAQYAQTEFVDKGVCQIVRSPVLTKIPPYCRWYSMNSWKLLTAGRTEEELKQQPCPKLLDGQNQGFDKLDDLGDTMLIALAFLKKY